MVLSQLRGDGTGLVGGDLQAQAVPGAGEKVGEPSGIRVRVAEPHQVSDRLVVLTLLDARFGQAAAALGVVRLGADALAEAGQPPAALVALVVLGQDALRVGEAAGAAVCLPELKDRPVV